MIPGSLDYAPATQIQGRRPSLRAAAFFVAAVCVFIDFAGWYMTGHGLRPSAVLKLLFIRINYAYVANTVVGLISLIIGLLPPWPSRAAG
jgi:hypothetical protein